MLRRLRIAGVSQDVYSAAVLCRVINRRRLGLVTFLKNRRKTALFRPFFQKNRKNRHFFDFCEISRNFEKIRKFRKISKNFEKFRKNPKIRKSEISDFSDFFRFPDLGDLGDLVGQPISGSRSWFGSGGQSGSGSGTRFGSRPKNGGDPHFWGQTQIWSSGPKSGFCLLATIVFLLWPGFRSYTWGIGSEVRFLKNFAKF